MGLMLKSAPIAGAPVEGVPQVPEKPSIFQIAEFNSQISGKLHIVFENPSIVFRKCKIQETLN